MRIEIESFFGDRLISSEKEYQLNELQVKVMRMIQRANTTAEDFTTLFCRTYQFEELPYSDDIRVDFVIDLDIHHVYKPCYGVRKL
jgi:TorA maturation chaperone TorD